jgi:tetratricopeptide (TPR) repeat protein
MKVRVGKVREQEARTASRRSASGTAPSLPPQQLETESGSPLALPERLGQYRLGEVLGQGGMGRVYAAYDEVLHREVALKLLWRVHPDLLVRFLQEAQFQARLDHPNICKIYEVGTSGPVPFIAMERIHGLGLLDLELDLGLDAVLDLMIQCADAVQAAHEAGLIHRDLKPGNILLARDPEGRPYPVLLDFGLAKALEGPGLTIGSKVVGTPAFMAPEQAWGKGVSTRSDVYSLGATFYAFLAGRSPFHAESAGELLIKQSQEEPPPLRSFNRDVPGGLAMILHTCLQRDPVLRYGSARALAEDLRRLRAGKPIQARLPLLRRPWLRASALAAALTALAGGAWLALRPVPPPLAGRQGTAQRPLRILWVGAGSHRLVEPWMAKDLKTIARDAIGEATLTQLDPAPEEVPAGSSPGLSTIRDLLRRHDADLALTMTIRERGGRPYVTFAALRPGQFWFRTLLGGYLDAPNFLETERTVQMTLAQRLGRPAPGHPIFIPRRLETRQALVQATLLIQKENNAESDHAAMALLRSITAEEPDYQPAHVFLASILVGMATEAAHHGHQAEIVQRLAETRAACRRAIELDPSHPAPYLYLGSVLRLEGDLEGAERAGQQALQVQPQSIDALLLLAMVAGSRPGEAAYLRALDYARTATRLAPTIQHTHYRLAQLYADAGQFPQAMKAVDEALAVMPTMEYAHVLRSNILLWSGRTEEAEAMLKASLVKVPNSSLLKRNLVLTAYLAHNAETFPARLAIAHGIWPEGHPTQVLLNGLDDAFHGRWAKVGRAYGAALAKERPRALGQSATERTSLSVDFYLMGRVLAGSPNRSAAKPFIAFAETLAPKRLRLAQRDPAFHGLWPEPEPWFGD